MPDWLSPPEGLPEGYRLLRDQKDTPVILVEGTARMPGVRFEHAMHEGVVSSCRACHHESLQACGVCHTPEGKEEGAGVELARAYHAPDAIQSCVGCHRRVMQAEACVGCHGDDPVTVISSEGSCPICHHEGERPPAHPLVPEHPLESVSIEHAHDALLPDRFGPATMDHEKHLGRLQELLAAGPAPRLANRFHHERQFLCMACHHHGPPLPRGAKPPTCTACHQQQLDPDHPAAVPVPAAYHRQCVGCHDRMKVRKDGNQLGCEDCHPLREEKP
jgi:hypothetical protein